ncbi:transcriptional regulator [Candidatus Poribacteria bacterium]|nr:transcriptional regulator [Candidatus Poribacteria bacterium]
MMPHRDYRAALINDLRDDAEEGHAYLEEAFAEYDRDGDTAALLLALRTVAEAQGGIGRLAKATDVRRQTLHKALSAAGNPRLNTVGAILRGLGYRIALEPVDR